MKALILAGGRGKRFGKNSELINKCMIMLGGKPIIEYNLDNIISTDVNEIIIVVGYRAREIIKNFGQNYKGKPVQYVNQKEQKGIVHAIQCSKRAIAGDDFVLMLGDEVLIKPHHISMVKKFSREGLFSVCGVVIEKDRRRIRQNYSIITDERDRIYRLVEKPRNPPNDLMGTGNCIFKNEILDYIKYTPINMVRREKEFPDLVQCAVDDGKLVKSFVICDKYVNINSNKNLLYAKKLLSMQ